MTGEPAGEKLLAQAKMRKCQEKGCKCTVRADGAKVDLYRGEALVQGRGKACDCVFVVKKNSQCWWVLVELKAEKLSTFDLDDVREKIKDTWKTLVGLRGLQEPQDLLLLLNHEGMPSLKDQKVKDKLVVRLSGSLRRVETRRCGSGKRSFPLDGVTLSVQ